jgi:hypothetical protein|nr:MAG TPA_asm: hypothetical protein [Caudoviricetes sp.]
MSETDFLKLKKHDNPETNTEKFDIENYLNGNWDKINENVKKVNTDISNINSKNKEQDTNIEQLQENTETSSNKIAELEKELKEAQEDFYQNSIRGQASGEYIHVEDSSNCRARIGIGGNSEQKMRSGKNYLNTLAKYKAGEKVTVDGITYIFNEDGSITCNGTATADSVLTFSSNLQTINGSGKKIVGMITGTQVPAKLSILAYTSDWSKNTFELLSSVNKNITINMQENIDYTIFRIIAYKGTTLNNQTIYYQILDTSVNDLTYEQYGASPSPNYPSKVVAVGSNVNEFDIDTVKDGFLNEKTGEIISNNSWKCSDFIEILNKTYTFGWESSSDYFQVTVCYYDENKKFISGKSYGLRGTFNNTFEVVSNAKYMKIAYSVSVRGEVATREKIKLEKGKVATPYSKYGQGCVKVTKCNKNIFKETYNRKDLTSAYFSIVKGKGFLEKDKTYVISFDTTNNGGIVYLGESSFQHINTFTVKCDGTRKFFTAKAKEFGYVTDITVLKTRAVTTNAYNISNVMINEYENDTDIDYVQHEEQSYIMPTQKEMLKDDYFDFENEEEVHMWGKYTFIGEEDYQKSQTYSNDEYLCAYIPTPVINNIKIDGKGLSSHFNRIGDFTTYQNEECVRTSGQLQIRVLVSRLTENSVEGLKAYLKSQYDAGTPVVVYYQLATPTRLKFTNEQKAVAKELNNARTYKNVTNITTDSKAILSLDYVKDQETQNQKMQNEIDEIKQLLSTTQTSAMLLDNLQKEVESEVE